MLLKVLGENSVKVLMEDQDIDLYNLPFEKVNYEDPYSRAFIYELIKKAYEETGVDFQDCRVMVEVIPGVSRSYYILITKLMEEGEGQIEFDKVELGEPEVLIFRLVDGLQVYRFLKAANECFAQKSSLYFYDGAYYVVLEFSPQCFDGEELQLLLKKLEEYGGRCRYRYINEALLNEWGELLATPDAFKALYAIKR